MDDFEKQVPLEEEDIQKLKKNAGGAVGCVVAMAAVFIAPVIWMLTWPFSWFQVLLIFAVLGIGSLLVYLTVNYALATKRNVAKDISGGVKKILISPMESQEMKSRAKRVGDDSTRRGEGFVAGLQETGELEMSYFIKVKGENYEVPIETYMAIRPGELVEIHRGIHSDTLLRVVKAEQPLSTDPNEARNSS